MATYVYRKYFEGITENLPCMTMFILTLLLLSKALNIDQEWSEPLTMFIVLY